MAQARLDIILAFGHTKAKAAACIRIGLLVLVELRQLRPICVLQLGLPDKCDTTGRKMGCRVAMGVRM